MMNYLICKGVIFKEKVIQILKNERGDGSDGVSFIMKIAIGVIVGGIIIGLLTVAIPDLWTGLINRIKSVFSI
ncbi:hypothetical protein [Ruminiclostridium cellobioparum]|uniref:hypothetical protein n=1 Tax=Ruminiclostridium cellobioparum TaxID=29355 RepID=UPI0028AE5688|nr:hypothetical protein [Ruminiclostridium cellobioparum]